MLNSAQTTMQQLLLGSTQKHAVLVSDTFITALDLGLDHQLVQEISGREIMN